MSQKKDVTMLVAHPDDEFLFGFPVIKRAKKIIACVDDMTHPTRQWCRRRKEALEEVCKMVGAEFVCLRYDSGFAKLDAGRDKPLGRFVADVRAALKGSDITFTHNDWGEYGHIDHQLLHTLVKMHCAETRTEMWTTDIVLEADWFKPKAYHQAGYGITYVRNDMDLHNKCVQIYQKYGAFGWTYAPVPGANLQGVQV